MAELRTAVDDEAGRRTQCWCCGCLEPPARMVTLGNHPEVALCLRCAHFVHQRASAIEDRGRTGPGVVVRNRLRAGRRLVMDRGWHRSPVVGRLLRRLGRHLP